MIGHQPRTTATLTAALSALLILTGCATAPTTDAATSTPSTPAGTTGTECAELPQGYSFIADIDPSIEVDLRYAGSHNFTGDVVNGYQNATDAVLRTDAATALAAVHEQFADQGLGVLIYDGFRPTRAVDNFVAWSHTPDDHTKAEFYPTLEKPQLFEQGYIAAESNHSLGGTVDLTLVQLDTGEPLDMGGEFDLFDVRSHGDSDLITTEQAQNRALLNEAMVAAGFAPYAEEWWHFSYPVPADAVRADFALQRCTEAE